MLQTLEILILEHTPTGVGVQAGKTEMQSTTLCYVSDFLGTFI